MARDIATEIMDQYRAGELFPYFLLDMTIDGTSWKYTSLDVSQRFTYSDGPSGTYQPLGFNFDSVSYSLGNIVDDAQVRIENLDQVQTALFVGGTVQGSPAILYAGVLNPSGGNIGTFKFFEGEIDDFSIDEEILTVTLSSPFTKWSNTGLGKHSSSCRWKLFKGDECKYTGDATACDRSYERCVSLENTDNFGGFRFLAAFESKTIWWGPTPKQRRAEEE